VRVDSFPGEVFAGAIAAINSRIDSNTRNVQVRASLANPGLKLLPGMYATIEIEAGAPKRLLTLPVTSITFNPYGSTVFVSRPTARTTRARIASR